MKPMKLPFFGLARRPGIDLHSRGDSCRRFHYPLNRLAQTKFQLFLSVHSIIILGLVYIDSHASVTRVRIAYAGFLYHVGVAEVHELDKLNVVAV